MRTTRLRGARTNNLRGIDLDLAPGTLVAIAGPSGAGKSSLAFGTLYAEGQRRYVESFSAYARQFLERLARPPVDELDPVPAAIAVDRQAPVRTSRSTVGTMTEVTDYAKSLWARAASLFCPGCGQEVRRDDPERAAARVLASVRDGERVVVTYPQVVADAEHFVGVREALVADGYRRIVRDGVVVDLDSVRPSDVLGAEALTKAKRGAARVAKSRRKKKRAASAPAPRLAEMEVVIDRAVVRAEERARLVEALEAGMRRGAGRVDVRAESGERLRFSAGLHCAECDRSFRSATPGIFSFNNPVGACKTCRGFGRTIGVDFDKVLPDPRLTLDGGAIRAWHGKSTAMERRELAKWAKRVGVPMDVPVAELTPAQREWLLEGDGVGWPKGWWGLRGWFEWLESRAYKMHVRVFLSRYRKYERCAACGGARLAPEALAWKVDGATLPELYAMPVARALPFVQKIVEQHAGDPPTALLAREVLARLEMLSDVGLPYLTLERASRTLSGGETQRVALTSALGASLTGAMFVLDEPTVGLHPRDVERLFAVVTRLCRGDNVAVVVEHDEAVLRGADRVVELGPGAGEHGGTIVFDGTPEDLARADTKTGRALRATDDGGARRAAAGERRARRSPSARREWLELRGASGNNLKGVDARFPLGAITCVTGPSGSGKSSLLLGTLWPAVSRRFDVRGEQPLPYESVRGHEGFTGVVLVDQSPLGRTSRGNPATYLGAWDAVRRRFSRERVAKERKYGPGMFSFNVPGGRCEACKGEGAETVEMQFLADVTFSCPECGGRRFVGPVLEVLHRGMSIADVLWLTATEAVRAFVGDLDVLDRLAPLVEVGLGYLRLGQPLNTLSGGEAERLKLAEAFASARPGSLVLLDEPTAGLHADDIAPLLHVVDRLAARGDTIVIVEHDMRVAAHADHVIDLGPGAGDEGGRIVAAGAPEEVAAANGSATAPFLARALGLPATAPADLRVSDRAQDDGADGVIEVVHAHEHNLKRLSVRIPREKLVVVTGPSGSGKSTLAFDVVYAEGQRRYLETLTPYARQYLPQLPRPAVDKVAGVPPSVSLEQRTTRGGSTSTVATITEVAHYLRLLWARAGTLHCPDCLISITGRTAAALARDLRERFGEKTPLAVLAPIVRGKKGIHRTLLERARKNGFAKARIDGVMVDLVHGLFLDRYREHDVEVLVGETRRSGSALEELLSRGMLTGNGSARVLSGDEDLLVSTRRACPSCGTGFPELDPRFFSFNTRQGACETCEGRGARVVTRGRGASAREELSPCNACGGTRLSRLARAVTVGGLRIDEVFALDVERALAGTASLPAQLTGRDAEVGRAPIAEARRRLAFLERVGLGYLGLDRSADTLSGGEMQRVRLAAQLGSGLTGVLYVLDEPTIGLHPRDTDRLLGSLRELVSMGNSVLVVEHDEGMIRAAEHVIDVGPGGGRDGGRVVAEGAPAALLHDPRSVTGPALARPASIPALRRPMKGARLLELVGASEHNLRGVDLRVPIGRLVAVTGVSGSGKSTLVRDVLLRATRRALGLTTEPPGAFKALRGAEQLRRAVEIDQSPIGRTPRSVPATYTAMWDELRKLLAGTPEARARGYGPSRFSFNVAVGRCPDCEGQGALTVEMSFLPEVLVPCETCAGRRFDRETLEVKLHGLDAGGILELDVGEAASVFAAVPKVVRPLRLLEALGLGYLKLGQASSTLSGGEAQRLKLVAELAATSDASAGTLYVMDEPTTGLHRDDVSRLVGVLGRLVDRGDTVVVIEHHPDVIVAADHVIDLGPEGGGGGGRIVAEGTPEEIARVPASHTGAVIARILPTAKPMAAAPARAVAHVEARR